VKKVNFNEEKLIEDYLNSSRWSGVKRNYKSNDVASLRTPFKVQNTISERGSNSLWDLLNKDNHWVSGLGAATVQQGVQMMKAGLEIIYISGWQIASESNIGENTYPDLSLYPSNSGPNFVKKMNNTLLRVISEKEKPYLPPIIADAESGFGGIYSVYNLTSQFINSGVSALHFEDQLASEKKCGHMGGKVVIPTHEFINKLNAARLASDVAESPIILIGRTDALNAKLITSDFDEVDKPYLTGKRTQDGYFELKNQKELSIAKSLAYAEFADVIWCETNEPDLGFAKEFSDEIKSKFPNKLLAYNCSPSFNWTEKFSDKKAKIFRVSPFIISVTQKVVSFFQDSLNVAERLAFAEVTSSGIPLDADMSKTYELLEFKKEDMTSLDSYIKEYYQQILKRLREMEADLNIEEKKRLPF